MNKIRKIIPSYAVVPLIFILLFNFAAYYISKIIIADRPKYDFSMPIDDYIPLVAPFIVIYLLAYAQWVIGYIVLARQNRELCSRVAAANIIGKTLCFLIFIIIPTEMQRPEVVGTGLFSWITKLIYFMDTPINLFPSIHCLESYAIMRFTIPQKNIPIAYKIATSVFSVLVFMSVVFTKQHIFIDIPAGILVLEIGVLISRLAGFDKVFNRNKNKI